jgi:L-arabinonolactonase
MFGGPRLDRLFVPSLSPAFMGRNADPLDGSLYVVDGLGVQGLPESRFGA